jgi:formylglycine-generating enzyme required for sulfatase activity
VSEGFVYIPPGDFLFGSDADEDLRRDFFHTAPLHEIRADGYLIAKNETTFSDWLTYVESLPTEQQSERLPRVEKGGFQGALTLRRDEAGAWQIDFQPTIVRYVASSGQQVRFGKRDRRKEQDWLRFPVFGITADDAVAYTRWLAESGRVPGARLCTGFEWEQGARGSDGRDYPHGERLSRDDANFDDTYDKIPEAMGPDEVCSHRISDSPFGLCDMAGNVWEWTVSSLSKREFAARGGSYLFGQNSARVTGREVTETSFRDVSVGMRVCADVARTAESPR